MFIVLISSVISLIFYFTYVFFLRKNDVQMWNNLISDCEYLLSANESCFFYSFKLDVMFSVKHIEKRDKSYIYIYKNFKVDNYYLFPLVDNYYLFPHKIQYKARKKANEFLDKHLELLIEGKYSDDLYYNDMTQLNNKLKSLSKKRNRLNTIKNLFEEE